MTTVQCADKLCEQKESFKRVERFRAGLTKVVDVISELKSTALLLGNTSSIVSGQSKYQRDETESEMSTRYGKKWCNNFKRKPRTFSSDGIRNFMDHRTKCTEKNVDYLQMTFIL
jgi:hypothetical protein